LLFNEEALQGFLVHGLLLREIYLQVFLEFGKIFAGDLSLFLLKQFSVIEFLCFIPGFF